MTADIAFIGSGLSTTATLIRLFEILLTRGKPASPLAIAIIEKNEEWWLGLPYGCRSSPNALIITCVYDFLDEPERTSFCNWLLNSRSQWETAYRQRGGEHAERWLQRNSPLIDAGKWKEVYTPRFIFGLYLLEKWTGLLAEVTEKQVAHLITIKADAVSIKRPGDYEITLDDQGVLSSIQAPKVVVAIGSAPSRNFYTGDSGDFTYIDNIYGAPAPSGLKAIRQALVAANSREERNLLIIGSNASAIELLYVIEGMTELSEVINKVVSISPSGILPYPIAAEEAREHLTPNLDEAGKTAGYTLESLIQATIKDLKYAVRKEADVAYIATIISTTNRLLDPLGEEAKRQFIGVYGPRLSAMFRRSGPEYTRSARLLADSGKLTLVAGNFIALAPDSGSATMIYSDKNGTESAYPLTFKAVINCTGAEDLEQSSSKLIRSLLHDLNCKVNLSRKGFLVNERFEAAPGLYVMGPTLGGNMNSLIHFWHVENAPRIFYLAPHLASILAE